MLLLTLETLVTLAQIAGSFLRARFTREVYPLLLAILNSEDQESSYLLTHSPMSYQTSTCLKVQIAVLRTLRTCALSSAPSLSGSGSSSTGAMISSRLAELSWRCLPYLSSTCPLSIQTEAVQLYQALIDIDADLIWWHLLSLSNFPLSQITLVEPTTETLHPYCPNFLKYHIEQLKNTQQEAWNWALCDKAVLDNFVLFTADEEKRVRINGKFQENCAILFNCFNDNEKKCDFDLGNL